MKQNHVGNIFGFSTYGSVCETVDDIEYVAIIIDELVNDMFLLLFSDRKTCACYTTSLHLSTLSKYGLFITDWRNK